MIVLKYFYKRKRSFFNSSTAEVANRNLSNAESKDSISVETNKGPKVLCSQYHRTSESPCVPLARPESSIDDSDLEESAGGSSRISSTWKDFTLPAVEQSVDSLALSRSQCQSPCSPTLSDSGDQQCLIAKPPPKPPRTFQVDNTKDWSLVNGTKSSLGHSIGTFNYHLPSVDENSPLQSPERDVGPPKPPRTFEYVMVDSVSYSYDLNNCLSSPDDFFASPVERNFQSNSIMCTSFVDNTNPVKVNTKPRASTVTYLQDRSCLTLCNGFYDHKPDQTLYRSASYKSNNSYSRCFSEERVNKPSKTANKFEQKSFSLGRNADLNRHYNSELMTSFTEQKVSLRQSRGNKNRSKRQARYWDEDETSRLLQFSSSCPDIPDTSVIQRTKQLNNGALETWL